VAFCSERISNVFELEHGTDRSTDRQTDGHITATTVLEREVHERQAVGRESVQ